uniref:alpha-L-fucosidase n=1 Tax=Phallusia mammillata TaxID=59560 RepID=A0A6F9DE06_9ASCI|nr:alpha-L-fucosidase-like [Phallusia mammillata]
MRTIRMLTGAARFRVVTVTGILALVAIIYMYNHNQSKDNEETNQLRMDHQLLAKNQNEPSLKHSTLYKPTWESIDSRPLPKWFDEAKFGIFIHWGVYSVPSYISEWFWWEWQGPKPNPDAVEFMKKNYPPEFTYKDFEKMFTAEKFDPKQWADLFQESGAKYIVLTSKHHEGFTNWPSPYSEGWNSVDVGPHRDLVGDLADAIRGNTDLKYGLYYSLYEWFNPAFLSDKKSDFKSSEYINTKMVPEMTDLVNTYKPDIMWSDGDEGPDNYWRSTEFLAWLYNESPVKDVVVTNDRWGTGSACRHGGFYSCSNRYDPGIIQPHKWENCMTVDKKSWGYRRDAKLEDYLTIEELLSTLASTISCGGNLLMNIGPTAEGTIPPIFKQRLREMGLWLKLNGQAVYGSKPWRQQKDKTATNVWFTTKNEKVYAFLLSWPDDRQVVLGTPVPTPTSVVKMLGTESTIKWSKTSDAISITLPEKSPCPWAWVLELTGFE